MRWLFKDEKMLLCELLAFSPKPSLQLTSIGGVVENQMLRSLS